MEKIGGMQLDRVVGSNKDPEKVVAFLYEEGKDKVEGELEKTPRDKEIIDFSQKCLDEYLSDFGKKNIHKIIEEKIHVVPVGGVEDYTEGRSLEGVASVEYGSCIVDRNSSDIIFSLRLFHELYHIKVFTSINLNEDGYCTVRRSGFEVDVSGEEYFDLINETLNEYFCRKFFEEKIKNSELFDKKEAEEFVFDSPRLELLDMFEKASEELFQKNKQDFSSKEDIKKLFFEADINGNLLPIARLIEKTYGEGSFRKFGKKFKGR